MVPRISNKTLDQTIIGTVLGWCRNFRLAIEILRTFAIVPERSGISRSNFQKENSSLAACIFGLLLLSEHIFIFIRI